MDTKDIMSEKSMLLLQASAYLGEVYRDIFDSDYRRREEVRREKPYVFVYDFKLVK